MPLSSAPGKIYLFGEHAVVYGELAVPCAIEKRITVSCSESDDNSISIRAPQIGVDNFDIEFSKPSLKSHLSKVEPHLHYILKAIDFSLDFSQTDLNGLELVVESELPLGAGLGSSAAVSVATVDAVSRTCGLTHSLEQIADMAHKVEETVQGRASKADTFCSTMGGSVSIGGGSCDKLPFSNLPLTIGYDGGFGSTKELVSLVKHNKETYPFVGSIIHSIGDISTLGIAALEAQDLFSIGKLMNINHGLLSSLGVSSHSLDEMVWAAREAGALGAKLTGAGGAGCIVALDPDKSITTHLLSTNSCTSAFSVDVSKQGLIRK
tara:strand:+ start:1945 stop:2910 length:966 start_codon:yes stop_codon:yes gene_type:complete